MAPDRSPNRTPWALLVASAVLVPTVLAGLTLAWPRPQIESVLSDGARTALTAAGVSGGAVAFNGRDATISGVPAAQRMQAIQAVEGVDGVRIAQIFEPGSGGGAETGPGPAVAAQPFGIARSGASITLTGVVGSEAQKADLVAAAQATGRTVVDQITVTPNAGVPAGVDATGVGALARALAAATSDLTASIGPDGVTLSGAVADEAARAAAVQAVKDALPGVAVVDRLTIAASSGTGDLDAAAKQALQANITALIGAAPITFGPDIPALTEQGSVTVTKVLAAVKAAPGARLQIDGYVATGPGNGLLTAQQLSDQRAAAVRDMLVAGGVPADHLTAQGRGEGTTPADRALGRRVEITVV